MKLTVRAYRTRMIPQDADIEVEVDLPDHLSKTARKKLIDAAVRLKRDEAEWRSGIEWVRYADWKEVSDGDDQ